MERGDIRRLRCTLVTVLRVVTYDQLKGEYVWEVYDFKHDKAKLAWECELKETKR